MAAECNVYTCMYYCIVTVIIIIISTIILHILFYGVFSYWYVGKYHSNDIVRWREQRLSQIR